MFLNKTQRLIKALKLYFKKTSNVDLKSNNIEDLIAEAANTPPKHLYLHNVHLADSIFFDAYVKIINDSSKEITSADDMYANFKNIVSSEGMFEIDDRTYLIGGFINAHNHIMVIGYYSVANRYVDNVSYSIAFVSNENTDTVTPIF